jgi:hypothetical protein
VRHCVPQLRRGSDEKHDASLRGSGYRLMRILCSPFAGRRGGARASRIRNWLIFNLFDIRGTYGVLFEGVSVPDSARKLDPLVTTEKRNHS